MTNATLSYKFTAPLLASACLFGSFALTPSPARAIEISNPNPPKISDKIGTDYTGWVTNGSNPSWLDNGVQAKNKEVGDPATGDWYWFDQYGYLAIDRDVWINSQQKWCHYDENGRMVKGLYESNKGTYYFDLASGKMLHGEAYLNLGQNYNGWFHFNEWTGVMDKDADIWLTANGGKWVRYGKDGVMVKGEDYRKSKSDGKMHWWYFDPTTGAMAKGFTTLSTGNGGTKTVYYDQTMGWMLYGKQTIDGQQFEFDRYTGALKVTANTKAEEIITIAKSKLGAPYKHAGIGPNEFSCDGFTAWVYTQANVKVFDSWADSTYNAQSKYIKEHGRMSYSRDQLQPGDIVFFGSSWNNLRHSGIYLGNGQMIHAAGHYVNGVRIGVTIGPLDSDFLGGGTVNAQ